MSRVTKLSVSVPSRVWEDVERFLATPGETRSKLVTRVLSQAAKAARDVEIDAEYARAYRDMPESNDERAAHAALQEATHRRFAELDRQEGSSPVDDIG
jgi:metal-responsive CopG/Arc/MetJ family transcriptional regulator